MKRFHSTFSRDSMRIRLSTLALVSPCALCVTRATLAQGSTSLVDRSSIGAQALGTVYAPAAISGDGRIVAFATTADNIVPSDTNGAEDVFVHDRLTGITTRISVSATGEQGNASSDCMDITPDGRFVLMMARASNLVQGDTNGVEDTFLFDRTTGQMKLVSQSTSGEIGNGDSGWCAMTPDGRYVAFTSWASNLVPGDVNGVSDVFVRDVVNGTTELVSVSTSGAQGDADSGEGPSISADGRFVSFTSQASNFVSGDTNDYDDVFVRDRWLQTTTLVSVNTLGTVGDTNSGRISSISADGRYLAFDSRATDLVPGGTQWSQVFVRDLVLGITKCVSVDSAGLPGDYDSNFASISADGRYVAYSSGASNLVPLDTNGVYDVFRFDRVTGTTELMSVSSSGVRSDSVSDAAYISADGAHVLFRSSATTLIPLDANGSGNDIYVRDVNGCNATIASYCTAAVTTHGCTASMSGIGTPSASAGAGFTIHVDGVEGQKSGLIFYGIRGPTAVPFGGGSSVLCVLAPIRRSPVQNSGGNAGACDGQFDLDWNAFITAHPIGVGAPFVGGETVWAQAWFRDPSAVGGSNLSNALWFTVCP